VVKAYERDISIRKLAARFDVSKAFVQTAETEEAPHHVQPNRAEA